MISSFFFRFIRNILFFPLISFSFFSFIFLFEISSVNQMENWRIMSELLTLIWYAIYLALCPDLLLLHFLIKKSTALNFTNRRWTVLTFAQPSPNGTFMFSATFAATFPALNLEWKNRVNILVIQDHWLRISNIFIIYKSSSELMHVCDTEFLLY